MAVKHVVYCHFCKLRLQFSFWTLFSYATDNPPYILMVQFLIMDAVYLRHWVDRFSQSESLPRW